MRTALACAAAICFCAGSAHAQPAFSPQTCQEELLDRLSRDGIAPTSIQAGSTIVIRGEPFVVPLGATPDSLCNAAIAEFSAERERSVEIEAAGTRADKAEATARQERQRADSVSVLATFSFAVNVVLVPITLLFFVLLVRGLLHRKKMEGEIPRFARRRGRIKS